MVPSEKNEPDGGVQVTTIFVLQASVAVVVNVTARPRPPVHSTTMFDEQTMTGGVVSTTSTR